MDSESAGIYREEIVVSEAALDRNGHVNNVVYVRWMQDIAVRHFEKAGGAAASEAIGATWVVRTHSIEYLAPAFAGDRVVIETWVNDIRKVRSMRRYRFSHAESGRTLVKGATDWVFVNRQSGRPQAVPEAVRQCFILLPDDT